jgi:DNA-binding winged helix-turn-helix (wHTH) protein
MPALQAEADLCFGPFRLEGSKRLWREDQLVALRPRPLAVLRYLAEQAGRIVTGEELLKRLWPGIYVTKTVLRVCVREIRQALGEEFAIPRFIETVDRQGYRFIAPLSIIQPEVSIQHPVSARPSPPSPRPQLTTPFVGRERELILLLDLLERVKQGERQTVFLFGEAGVGKTALIDRFLNHARASGPVRIGRGQCFERHGSGEAYLPILEALELLCQGSGGSRYCR